MEMQKDLQSLKSLYRILQTSANANDMDEGARLLFKNLLDSARDNALLATSKIISTGRSMSSNSCNSIHSNVYMHNSRILEEQSSIRKPFSPHSVSVSVSEQNTKKRCRVCQQSKRQTKDESSCDFSKQVSNSIKLIESTILSLQLSSDISNPIKLESLEEAAATATATSTRNWAENSPNFLVPAQRNESPGYHYVHGLRIPSIRDHHGMNTADPSPKTSRNDSLTLPDKNLGMLVKRRPSMQSRLDCASTANSHNQNLMEPMLLDESFAKKPHVRQQQKMTIPYQQESDVSSSSLQGSDVQSAVSSPTSSYSSTSQPETETSHTTPETSPEESTSDSSVTSSQSYRNTGGSSRKMHRKNPDKATGRLRRLKNKLELIFHHHHHHHHHNHGENETNNAKDHRSSMWKHLGNIFHHKDKERMCEKQAVRKLKTLPVNKKQVGQFQALVKGMARHVKQSKKSKVAKGRIRSHHDNRHWWQLFHGGRRGVKLPNAGRIRLQVKGKKPQLRAPKIVK
ncbi:protein KOKOPELLI [Euphorbia lathyris]|uniref:protein KOKOPELLI n=1 Tax=Euphorbia lathyris TaxID=212925 RepID=UPI003313DBAB